MFNKSEYIKKLNRLLMSMNIKIEESPYQIEYFLYTQYGINKPDYYLDDKKKWKYYVNITGEYHFLDTPMYVYNRNTDSEMLLTKTNLALYPDIKADLLEFSTVYNTTVEKYPLQESLIKSILLPVDIDVALDAETGTILTYDSNMIDSNEYSLISELQEYIYGIMGRYYISDYALVDNLYIPSVLVILYSNLRLKIENIRLRNCFTYEAHSYHVGAFFRSHLDIDLELDILPANVKMWLYKNLRYIERHTGKDKTLKLIVDKILDSANVGIGEINIIKEDSERNNALELASASYKSGEIKFKSNPLNSKYLINKNKTYDLAQIVKRELLLTENKKLDAEVIINDELNSTKTEKFLLENTKILELDDKINLRSRTIPELHVLIDNWFYYAFKGTYTHIAEIKDENTNKIYTVNAKQAALMLIKLFVSSVNKEDKVLNNFKAGTILRDESDLAVGINRLFLDNATTKPLVDELFKLAPTLPSSFTSSLDMKNYLTKMNNLSNQIWYTISNSGNAIISATIKRLQDRLYLEKVIDLTIFGREATIDELLDYNNVNYVLTSNYDYLNMIKQLVYAFTGLKFNTSEEDIDSLEKYTSLIKKITSYSLQVIYTPLTTSSIESPYTPEEILMLSKPLITCTEAVFSPLEDFYGDFYSKEYKWVDDSDSVTSLDEYIGYDCTGGLGFSYYLDPNYTRSNNLLNVNMNIDNMCLDLYVPSLGSEVNMMPSLFVETSIVPLYWLNDDTEMNYATASTPSISHYTREDTTVDMSINYRDIVTEANVLNHNEIYYVDKSLIDLEPVKAETEQDNTGFSFVSMNDVIIDNNSNSENVKIHMAIDNRDMEFNILDIDGNAYNIEKSKIYIEDQMFVNVYNPNADFETGILNSNFSIFDNVTNKISMSVNLTAVDILVEDQGILLDEDEDRMVDIDGNYIFLR